VNWLEEVWSRRVFPDAPPHKSHKSQNMRPLNCKKSRNQEINARKKEKSLGVRVQETADTMISVCCKPPRPKQNRGVGRKDRISTRNHRGSASGCGVARARNHASLLKRQWAEEDSAGVISLGRVCCRRRDSHQAMESCLGMWGAGKQNNSGSSRGDGVRQRLTTTRTRL